MSLISQEYANYLRFEEEQRMKKKNKKDTYCKADIRKAEEAAVGKCLTVFVACLMDELDMEREELNDFIDRFTRYSEAVDDKLINLQQVSKIIEEQTGVVVKWY